MADLSDVTATLCSIVAGTLYPTAPTAINQKSTAGVPVRILVGWPDPKSVDGDKKCGRTSVSLYPMPHEINSTRYPRQWQTVGPFLAQTFSLTSAAQTITISGAKPNPWYQHNLAAIIGGKPYIVSTTPTSTAAAIAAQLGALLAADYPGTGVSQAAVTLPAGASIETLRVGTGALVAMEVRRQTRRIQILILSPAPLDRDAVAKTIDPVLANLIRFDLPDGFGARLIYVGSPFNDLDQTFGLFRRDLLYDVEYPTTLADFGSQVIAFGADVTDQASGSPITTKTF